jgi:transglutaminase-like putative cysteine protease
VADASAGSTGDRDSGAAHGSRSALGTPRTLALLGIGALVAGYVATLYWVTTVVGGAAWLAAAVGLGLASAVACREIDERTVLKVAGGGAVTAAVGYYGLAGPSFDPGTVSALIADGLVMASGISIIQMASVDLWIAAIVPVPVFLTTYLGLRRKYGLATVASGWLVLFLALTGDAVVVETLLSAVGAVAAIGFGELDRRGGSVGSADLLVVLIAIMAVLAVAVPMVPSGSADPIYPGSADGGAAGPGGSGGGPTPLHEQLLSGDEVTAGGPIELSPAVQFVVASQDRRRWRMGVLGTYTGDGWSRSEFEESRAERLPAPPGPSRTVAQSYELRTTAHDLPAAAYPVDVDGIPQSNLEFRNPGTLTVDDRELAGTNYTVRSQVPAASADELRAAGTDYPEGVAGRYTALPEDTVPDRVHDLTDQVTTDADTPYETARAIEAYLEDTKGYSQDVSAPSSSMADGFLFEMEAGYCTYFAGTMATMLRTQGVPARVAVGYASGQFVGNDTWVVRGTDAHAWVEVYFPDVGWVEFDPTPTSSVRDARSDSVSTAREFGAEDVDVPESEGEDVRFEQPADDPSDGGTDANGTDGESGTTGNDSDGAGGSTTPNGTDSDSGDDTAGNDSGVGYTRPDMGGLPGGNGSLQEGLGDGRFVDRSGDRLLGGFGAVVIGFLVAAGVLAGGRRAGVHGRLRYASAVLWQRRRDPETDVRRAMERLDVVLERRHGPRLPGETRREYRRRLSGAVDDDVHRAFDLYERARYAGDVDRGTADELVGLVDDVARRDLPLVGSGE